MARHAARKNSRPRRALGAVAAFGTFAAPATVAAPAAHADGFEELLDLTLADLADATDPGPGVGIDISEMFGDLGLAGLDAGSGLGGLDVIFADLPGAAAGTDWLSDVYLFGDLPGSAAGGGTDFLSDAYTALYNALSNTISPIFQ
ncbi:hypothetical protein, partial [[Mycobacterium] crassicus]